MTIQQSLEQYRQDIITKYRNNISLNKIAILYGVNSGTMWYTLKKWGEINGSRKTHPNYGKLRDKKEEIRGLLEKGSSFYNIAQTLDVKPSSIKSFCKKNNLQSSHKCKVDYDNLVSDMAEEIFFLYDGGMRVCDIAEKLGRPDNGVRTVILKSGRELRDNTTYKVNEHYFDKIDSENRAYTLGWFYTDGCVDNIGKMRITLQEEDKEILEWITKDMEYTGPLSYQKTRNTSKPQWTLCINRKILADQLINKGCVPNKSLILTTPSYDIVPRDLYCHFMRGVFEGDGSISKKGGHVSITGSYSFTHSLPSILPCKITGLYKRYKDREDNKTAWQLFIGKREECRDFLNWIYPPTACMVLRRKHEIYKQLYL